MTKGDSMKLNKKTEKDQLFFELSSEELKYIFNKPVSMEEKLKLMAQVAKAEVWLYV